MNKKRVRRLYRLEGLQLRMRMRRSRSRPASTRTIGSDFGSKEEFRPSTSIAITSSLSSLARPSRVRSTTNSRKRQARTQLRRTLRSTGCDPTGRARGLCSRVAALTAGQAACDCSCNQRFDVMGFRAGVVFALHGRTAPKPCGKCSFESLVLGRLIRMLT